jgi:hypothetical protein
MLRSRAAVLEISYPIYRNAKTSTNSRTGNNIQTHHEYAAIAIAIPTNAARQLAYTWLSADVLLRISVLSVLYSWSKIYTFSFSPREFFPEGCSTESLM